MSFTAAMILMFCSVLVSSLAQICLKKAAMKQYSSFAAEYLNPWVIAGYGLLAASTLLVICAYRGMHFKNGPIIESLGYVLVMFLSWLFFQEKIGKRKAIGYALIVLGACIFYF